MTIINQSNIQNGDTFVSDVCIVGSGMSAQTLAATIDEFNNKQITIIESGKIDFEKNVQLLNNYHNVGIAFRKNFENRIRKLGGSGNLWASQLMMLEPLDIKDRSWIAESLSWPIQYEELKKYYTEAIKLIYEDYFKNVNLFDFKSDKKYISFLEEEFTKFDIFKLDNSFWPGKIEKFNKNSKFTKKLLNSKNIKFFEFFTATKIHVNTETQLVENLEIISNGKICKIKSNIFVLACGAIENARILLNNTKHNKILQNNNIGKYFMDHPRTNLGTVKSNKKLSLSTLFGIKKTNYDFRQVIRLSEKTQQDKKILNPHIYLDPKFQNKDNFFFENFLAELKKIIKLNGIPKLYFENFSLKILLEQIYLKIPHQVSNSLLNNVLRKFLERKNYYLSFSELDIVYHGEQCPNFQSKVTLSPDVDYLGQNIAIVDWKLNDIDYKTQNVCLNLFSEKFKDHKDLIFVENKKKTIEDCNHHSGTTRMSLDKTSGVVDVNSKVFDTKNLYISGNSVFRTAGSANPGLTNIALSIRLGKYINELIK